MLRQLARRTSTEVQTAMMPSRSRQRRRVEGIILERTGSSKLKIMQCCLDIDGPWHFEGHRCIDLVPIVIELLLRGPASELIGNNSRLLSGCGGHWLEENEAK